MKIKLISKCTYHLSIIGIVIITVLTIHLATIADNGNSVFELTVIESRHPSNDISNSKVNISESNDHGKVTSFVMALDYFEQLACTEF